MHRAALAVQDRRLRLAACALLACLCLWPTRRAHAQSPTLFTGSWSSLLGVDTRAEVPLEDIGVLLNRFDLDLRHPLGESMRTRIAARFSHRASVGHEDGRYVPAFRNDWPSYGMRYDQFVDLREAYVQWDSPTWGNLTVGRDLALWGALELQSPLRILNPTDFSMGLFGALGNGDDTAAMADFMVKWQRDVGLGALELVYLPFFTQHRFSTVATDTALVRPDLGPQVPAGLFPLFRRLDLRTDRAMSEALVYALKPPPATPLDGSIAARWKHQIGKWDLNFDAIYNWDRLPKLTFDKDIATVLGKQAAVGFSQSAQIDLALNDAEYKTAAQRLDGSGKTMTDLVKAEWQRRLTVGAEWSGELAEGWMLRGDAAFTPKKVLMDANFQPVVSALTQVGLGLEYSREDWLVAMLECSYQLAHDVREGQTLFMMARQQVTAVGGLVLRLGEGQPWTVQLGGMYGVSLHDYAAAPKVSYQLDDSWRVGLGAIVAGGPALSPGGLFKTDDQVLLDLRKSF